MVKKWWLLLALVARGAVAEETAERLWQQISFTATEVLVYADQLQKLESTACGQGAVSLYSTEATREELLQLLPVADRARLATLLDSPLVQQLLAENSAGIEALLGKPVLTTEGLDPKTQARCLELSLLFVDNQRQAREELEQLIGTYRQP